MIQHRRPIIGVTGPDEGGGAAWYFTSFVVWIAGGHAVRITPKHPRKIDGLDGLIIGGGADVDPSLYGQTVGTIFPTHKPDDEATLIWFLEWILLPLTWLARKASGFIASPPGRAGRDALEMRLLDEAVRRRLPVLGICRGAQLINVYFGGTLYQDLTGFYAEDPEVRTILPRKRIEVIEGTKLVRLLGARPSRVNALHRQAINQLGTGLTIAARDRNGVVQAIEHRTLPFVAGVQWHPEYLPQLHEQRAIFEALVRAARRRTKAEVTPPPAAPLPRPDPPASPRPHRQTASVPG